jgi:hypothetical protein
MRRSWLPKKIGYKPSGTVIRAGRSLFPLTAFASLSRIECVFPKSTKQNPFSLVKLPSRGLGLQNAKIARLLLPGAPL